MKRLGSLAIVLALLGGAPSCGGTVIVGDAPLLADAGLDAKPNASTKVDLLFVIDNSRSMADKQRELARRIPELVRLLTQIGATPLTAGLPRAVDLHVAVITTSLGSQGTSACDPKRAGAHADDHARLLPRIGEPLPASGYAFGADPATPVEAGCPAVPSGAPIRWALDPADASAPLHGAADLPAFEAAVTCTVLSAGADGCDYEQPLEAMYRFLADPIPAMTREASCVGAVCTDIRPSGRDDALLQQRAAFLRTDSLLAIVLLTDESDSSLRAEGPDWMPWAAAAGAMPRGLSACSNVPDTFEFESVDDLDRLGMLYLCGSCLPSLSGSARDTSRDPNCASDAWRSPPTGDDLEDVDHPNLRAFHQVERYGYDFLYPTSRYVDALSKPYLVDDAGLSRLNPIFLGDRKPTRIVLAGLVGVPKELVNDLSGYPKQLNAQDWEQLVSPDHTVRDGHMQESIGPRYELARFKGDPSVDLVHGGERDIADGSDLQYACLGPTVSDGAANYPDCAAPDASTTNPACLAGGGARLRAYPGIRPLRVIRSLGDGGYVASICDDDYRGAVGGLASKIALAAR